MAELRVQCTSVAAGYRCLAETLQTQRDLDQTAAMAQLDQLIAKSNQILKTACLPTNERAEFQ